MRQRPSTIALLPAIALLAGCAGNTPSPDTRSDSDCPVGQVLVCKGGEVNSRVKDSRLNQTDVCICRQKEPF